MSTRALGFAPPKLPADARTRRSISEIGSAAATLATTSLSTWACSSRGRGRQGEEGIQWPRWTTQRTETIVTCKVEVLHQRQALGPVDVLDHALTPAIRPGIVYCPHGDRRASHKAATRTMLHVDERQVLAQCETAVQQSLPYCSDTPLPASTKRKVPANLGALGSPRNQR